MCKVEIIRVKDFELNSTTADDGDYTLDCKIDIIGFPEWDDMYGTCMDLISDKISFLLNVDDFSYIHPIIKAFRIADTVNTRFVITSMIKFRNDED